LTIAPAATVGNAANFVPAPDDLLTGDDLAALHVPEAFDPTLHAANADGTPKLKADGTYARKRGRKAGAQAGDSAKSAAAGVLPNKPARSTQPAIDTSEATAAALIGVIEAVAVNAIGEEWRMHEAESAQYSAAVAAYMKSKGLVDVTPGIMVCICAAAYVGSRMSHENTRSKLARLFAGAGGFFGKARAFFRF
jgi:hypothetical protein